MTGGKRAPRRTDGKTVFNLKSAHSGSAARAPRRDTRYSVQGMTALDGEVLDLSSSGVQIRLNSKPEYEPGDRCTLRIKTGTQTLRMDASFAWIKRDGLLKPTWRVGLAFLDSRPSVRTLVETLAVTGYADPRRAKNEASPQASREEPEPSHNVHHAHDAEDGGGGFRATHDGFDDASGSHSSDEPLGGHVTIEPPNLYEILEVEHDADHDAIQASYRALVRRFHPDSGGKDANAERFTMVSKAYAVLRDPKLRSRYDERYPRAA
jgi:hypothetical protein